MAAIPAVGVSSPAPQGFINKTKDLLARTSACAGRFFATAFSWSVTIGTIVAAVVVIKIVATYPLTTIGAAVLGVFLYKNRHKIALLTHLYWAIFKDMIGLKKHAWFHQVNQDLVLGAIPMQGRKHPEKLQKMGVEGVLNLTDGEESQVTAWFARPANLETWQSKNIAFKHLPSTDQVPLSISRIDEAVTFINQRAQNGKKTYVYDAEGSGKAALVTACYLMKRDNTLSVKAAINQVKAARPNVIIQTAQLGRIYEYYDHLHG